MIYNKESLQQKRGEKREGSVGSRTDTVRERRREEGEEERLLFADFA